MRTLIAARPNLQPVGLGNNDTEYDTSILLPEHGDDDNQSSAVDVDEIADLPDQLSEPPVAVISSDSDEELLTIPTLANAGSIKRKRRAADTSTLDDDPKQVRKKTKPQPPTSAPAPATAPVKKATAKDRFNATVIAEEETVQRTLHLKREKTMAKKDVALAKIQMETEVRVAREESRRQEKAAKMELVRLKMEQEHQFRMAQMNARAGPSSRPFSGGASTHDSSAFFYDGLPLPTLPTDDQDASGQSTYAGFGSFDQPVF